MAGKIAALTVGLFLSILLVQTPVQAGFFDSAVKNIKEGTDQFGKDLKKAGQDLGIVDKGKSANNASTDNAQGSKLPGGVSSRLKKINTELNKAEKSLDKGVGTQVDRAKRAQAGLKRAQKIRDEINKRYKDKFSPENPEVKKTDERLAAVEKSIDAALSGGAPATPAKASSPSAPATAEKLPSAVTSRLKKMYQKLDRAESVLAKGFADQGKYLLGEARGIMKEIKDRYADKAPDTHPEMKKANDRLATVQGEVDQAMGKKAAAKAEKEKADQDAKKWQAESQKWVARLKPFGVSGPKALAPYPTDDTAVWQQDKARYDELKPAWDEYQKAALPEKSLELQSLEKELKRQIAKYDEIAAQRAKRQTEAAAMLGRIVFSKNPINAADPRDLTSSFKAGDHIYCFIQVKKTWKQIFRGNPSVMIRSKLDGKQFHAQFIKLKNKAGLDQKTLKFEIAPAPDKMTAYSDPSLEYGTSKANLRQGPQQMTLILSRLSPGKHDFEFFIQYGADVYAKGGFTIEGADYAFYADLHEKAKSAMFKSVTLPAAKMQNKQMEKDMLSLLKAAGWSDIHRVNIVDKDWWIDRASGGNSAVVSRHMAACALAKGKSGAYFYKRVTFRQNRLITGGWGKLEISHQGDEVMIPKENIDK